MSIIAHDLRSPFTGLLGITDFIVKSIAQFSQDEIKENVASLRESAKTVYALLENLVSVQTLYLGFMIVCNGYFSFFHLKGISIIVPGSSI